MSIEAMKMALEALCLTNNEAVPDDIEERREAAIEALRQALAQPEQEPVAWVIEDGEVDYYVDVVAKIKPGTPLYTAPPKREWVGLTEEEFELILEQHNEAFPFAVYQSIEAKLKEKNT